MTGLNKGINKLVQATKDSLNKRASMFTHQVITPDRNLFDVKVTQHNIDRAFQFFIALLTALESKGYTVIVADEKTYCVVNEIEIEIGLREKTKRVSGKTAHDISEYLPLNILCFKYHSRLHLKEWDDKKISLDSQIQIIISALEEEANIISEIRAENKKQSLEQDQRKESEKIAAKHRENEQREFDDLLNNAKRFQEARLIHDYVDEVEKNAIQKDKLTEELKEWINWARIKAEAYNPIMNMP